MKLFTWPGFNEISLVHALRFTQMNNKRQESATKLTKMKFARKKKEKTKPTIPFLTIPSVHFYSVNTVSNSLDDAFL